MKSKTTTRFALTVMVLASAALVGGCWDDDDEEPAPPITQVPASAGVSITSFIDFVKSLVSDETSEPLTIDPAFTAAVDETSEPQALP